MRVRSMGWGLLGLVAACGPVVVPPGSSSDGSTATEDGPPPTSTGSVATSGSTFPPGSEVDVDDGKPLDLLFPDMGPECAAEWPNGGCGNPSSGTTVMGTTPLGDFTTTRAVFGSWAGCGSVCDVEPNVLVIALLGESVLLEDLEPDPFSGPDETLMLALDLSGGGFQGPVGRPVGALLAAHRGGVTDQTNDVEAVIDLLPLEQELAEPFDPDAAVVVTGSLTVEAPGWSVAGTFEARYCPDINFYVICE